MKEQVLETLEVAQGTKLTKQEFINSYNQSKGELMFNSYSKNIDNHAYRAEYATELYRQLKKKYPQSPKKSGFNQQAAKEVSKALGHNRISVIGHYVRKD